MTPSLPHPEDTETGQRRYVVAKRAFVDESQSCMSKRALVSNESNIPTPSNSTSRIRGIRVSKVPLSLRGMTFRHRVKRTSKGSLSVLPSSMTFSWNASPVVSLPSSFLTIPPLFPSSSTALNDQGALPYSIETDPAIRSFSCHNEPSITTSIRNNQCNNPEDNDNSEDENDNDNEDIDNDEEECSVLLHSPNHSALPPPTIKFERPLVEDTPPLSLSSKPTSLTKPKPVDPDLAIRYRQQILHDSAILEEAQAHLRAAAIDRPSKPQIPGRQRTLGRSNHSSSTLGEINTTNKRITNDSQPHHLVGIEFDPLLVNFDTSNSTTVTDPIAMRSQLDVAQASIRGLMQLARELQAKLATVESKCDSLTSQLVASEREIESQHKKTVRALDNEQRALQALEHLEIVVKTNEGDRALTEQGASRLANENIRLRRENRSLLEELESLRSKLSFSEQSLVDTQRNHEKDIMNIQHELKMVTRERDTLFIKLDDKTSEAEALERKLTRAVANRRGLRSQYQTSSHGRSITVSGLMAGMNLNNILSTRRASVSSDEFNNSDLAVPGSSNEPNDQTVFMIESLQVELKTAKETVSQLEITNNELNEAIKELVADRDELTECLTQARILIEQYEQERALLELDHHCCEYGDETNDNKQTITNKNTNTSVPAHEFMSSTSLADELTVGEKAGLTNKSEIEQIGKEINILSTKTESYISTFDASVVPSAPPKIKAKPLPSSISITNALRQHSRLVSLHSICDELLNSSDSLMFPLSSTLTSNTSSSMHEWNINSLSNRALIDSTLPFYKMTCTGIKHRRSVSLPSLRNRNFSEWAHLLSSKFILNVVNSNQPRVDVRLRTISSSSQNSSCLTGYPLHKNPKTPELLVLERHTSPTLSARELKSSNLNAQVIDDTINSDTSPRIATLKSGRVMSHLLLDDDSDGKNSSLDLNTVTNVTKLLDMDHIFSVPTTSYCDNDAETNNSPHPTSLTLPTPTVLESTSTRDNTGITQSPHILCDTYLSKTKKDIPILRRELVPTDSGAQLTPSASVVVPSDNKEFQSDDNSASTKKQQDNYQMEPKLILQSSPFDSALSTYNNLATGSGIKSKKRTVDSANPSKTPVINKRMLVQELPEFESSKTPMNTVNKTVGRTSHTRSNRKTHSITSSRAGSTTSTRIATKSNTFTYPPFTFPGSWETTLRFAGSSSNLTSKSSSVVQAASMLPGHPGAAHLPRLFLGTWMLKWDRRNKSAHPRFFWINHTDLREGVVIMWAKHNPFVPGDRPPLRGDTNDVWWGAVTSNTQTSSTNNNNKLGRHTGGKVQQVVKSLLVSNVVQSYRGLGKVIYPRGRDGPVIRKGSSGITTFLVIHTGTRRLDLQAPTPDEHKAWFEGLKYLIDAQHVVTKGTNTFVHMTAATTTTSSSVTPNVSTAPSGSHQNGRSGSNTNTRSGHSQLRSRTGSSSDRHHHHITSSSTSRYRTTSENHVEQVYISNTGGRSILSSKSTHHNKVVRDRNTSQPTIKWFKRHLNRTQGEITTTIMNNNNNKLVDNIPGSDTCLPPSTTSTTLTHSIQHSSTSRHPVVSINPSIGKNSIANESPIKNEESNRNNNDDQISSDTTSIDGNNNNNSVIVNDPIMLSTTSSSMTRSIRRKATTMLSRATSMFANRPISSSPSSSSSSSSSSALTGIPTTTDIFLPVSVPSSPSKLSWKRRASGPTLSSSSST